MKMTKMMMMMMMMMIMMLVIRVYDVGVESNGNIAYEDDNDDNNDILSSQ